MTDVEQKLIAVGLYWIQQSEAQSSIFIPNREEEDKIAKTRTGACGHELLRILAGEHYKAVPW